jgi:hypothetical protein
MLAVVIEFQLIGIELTNPTVLAAAVFPSAAAFVVLGFGGF